MDYLVIARGLNQPRAFKGVVFPGITRDTILETHRPSDFRHLDRLHSVGRHWLYLRLRLGEILC